MESPKPVSGERPPEQALRLSAVLETLKPSNALLKELLSSYLDQLEKGLEMHKKYGLTYHPESSDFRMLDSCVRDTPERSASGLSYAIDFGGSTLRTVRCHMDGNGQIQLSQCVKDLSCEDAPLMRRSTKGSDLFDELATCILDLMNQHGDVENARQQPLKIGMAFSFPGTQTDIKSSILECWTKGFETGRGTDDPVESKDVGMLLEQALQRKNVPANVVAIVNDTVGTLLSCAYQKPKDSAECRGGVILGTGHNCCYIEPEAEKYGYKGRIINVESANYQKKLPMTMPDIEIDKKSPNPGQHLYEKQISGYYLGELTRLFMLRVFQHRAPETAWTDFSLSSGTAAAISQASTPEEVAKILSTEWGIKADPTDAQDIQKIAYAVFERSAALAAVTFAAIYIRTSAGQHDSNVCIGVDGSLYSKNPWYATLLKQYLREIISADADKINIVLADDGSGKGAALCAHAISDKKECQV